MELSLLIQVYNGGDYWKECWESVCRNLDFFDQVFISIGKSPLQAQDVNIVKQTASDKIHYIAQTESLSALVHGHRLQAWFRKFQVKGHVFFLCHDDILSSEGLQELSALSLKEKDAVFGTFRFFYEDQARRELTCREFYRYGKPISGQEFCFLQDQQRLSYNLSGTVLPASLYQQSVLPWDLLHYGYRSEVCHFCNPYVEQIYQTWNPTVRIRMRSHSEGTFQNPKMEQYDTLVFLLQSFAVYRDSILRNRLARSVLYIIAKSPLSGIRSFLTLQITLGKLPYYYPAVWKIYPVILGIIFRKGLNFLRRLAGGWK